MGNIYLVSDKVRRARTCVEINYGVIAIVNPSVNARPTLHCLLPQITEWDIPLIDFTYEGGKLTPHNKQNMHRCEQEAYV